MYESLAAAFLRAVLLRERNCFVVFERILIPYEI